MQLTLEERLRQRRSGRRLVKELANATPQERARHDWGVMREAVLAMHQHAAGEVSPRSACGGSQVSSAVTSTRESHGAPQEGRMELTEANDPSRDTSAHSPGRIPVVSFRGAIVTPMPSSGRVRLVEAEGEVADATGEYTGEYPVRKASAQSIDAKLSKLVHHSEDLTKTTTVSVITDTLNSERLDGVNLTAE